MRSNHTLPAGESHRPNDSFVGMSSNVDLVCFCHYSIGMHCDWPKVCVSAHAMCQFVNCDLGIARQIASWICFYDILVRFVS